MIEEPESAGLQAYLTDDGVLAISRIALVEVPRATKLANPSDAVREETGRLLASCLLVDVSDKLLRRAAALTSAEVRTLEAIHLATALYIDADEFVAYDRRLLDGARSHRLRVVTPTRG
jgi:uncharacterized protein